MPKYYRFRAKTPTRKLKKTKEREREKEVEERRTNELDRGWFNLTLACSMGPPWYLRRISWRASPIGEGPLRQMASGLRSSLNLGNRPIFVFKTGTDLF